VSVFRRFLADRRSSFRGWTVAAVLLMLMTVVFFPTIRDQPSLEDAMRDLPDALKATFGISDAVPISSPAGYLQGRLFSLTLPLALVIFAISVGARAIGGSEEDGDLELLLAQPVTRRRVLVERFASVATLVLALGAVFTVLLLVLGPPFGILEHLAPSRVVGACAGGALLALLHGAAAFAAGAVTGRRSSATGVAAAVAGGGYLLQGLLAAARTPAWTRYASPWHWYLRRNMLVEGIDPLAFVLPLIVVGAAFVVSVLVFDRRDLR
jgi:ABC-2 type transport system permease protein